MSQPGDNQTTPESGGYEALQTQLPVWRGAIDAEVGRMEAAGRPDHTSSLEEIQAYSGKITLLAGMRIMIDVAAKFGDGEQVDFDPSQIDL